MPGQVAPLTDERELLLAYLTQHRYVLKLAAHGLSDEQARMASPPSSLTVGGLIKHVGQVESYWIDLVVQRQADVDTADSEYEDNFRLEPGETLASVIDKYDAVARETAAVIDKIADLSQPVPVPPGVPWFPDDVEAWSVRWVLLHLITETTRHAGHADIVREAVDGATAFPLMAAVEHWPATDYLQPWSPTVA